MTTQTRFQPLDSIFLANYPCTWQGLESILSPHALFDKNVAGETPLTLDCYRKPYDQTTFDRETAVATISLARATVDWSLYNDCPCCHGAESLLCTSCTSTSIRKVKGYERSCRSCKSQGRTPCETAMTWEQGCDGWRKNQCRGCCGARIIPCRRCEETPMPGCLTCGKTLRTLCSRCDRTGWERKILRPGGRFEF